MQNGSEKRPQDLSALGKDGLKKLLDSVDTFIFDCDGVVWHFDQMIPASPKLVTLLRKLGKKVLFITNNSLFSLEDILAKFARGGISVPKDDLIFPAISLCHYLKKINFKGKIEILGQPALKNEVRGRGFDVNDSKDITALVDGESEFRDACVVKENVSAVVVDIDLNGSFVKITRIIDALLKNPDCLLFSCAPDRLIPITPTLVTAGPQYILKIIEDITGKKPRVLGKPSTGMFEILKERHFLNPDRTIFVGDSLDSDIRMSRSCGLRSILVLSGTAKREHIPMDDPNRRPHYISEGVTEIHALLEVL